MNEQIFETGVVEDEHLTRWLIAAAKGWKTLTYGEAARRLGRLRVDARNVMGRIADSSMDKILGVDTTAPLLVSLLVQMETDLPGPGFHKYLSRRHEALAAPGVGGRCCGAWKAAAKQEQERVYVYRFWGDLYELACAAGSEAGRDVACRGGATIRVMSKYRKPLIPNDATVAAMEAVRRREFAGTGSFDDMMADLNTDD